MMMNLKMMASTVMELLMGGIDDGIGDAMIGLEVLASDGNRPRMPGTEEMGSQNTD